MTRGGVRSGMAWVGALCVIASVVPPIARAIKYPSLLGAKQAPQLRKRLLHHAARVLGSNSTVAERSRLADAILGNFYDFLVDLSAGRRMTIREIADRAEEVKGIDHYLNARQRGKGVIIATAHMGDFETGIAALRSIESNILVVFKRDDLPVFERLRSFQRRRLGVVEAPVDDGLKTWLMLRDALRSNATVLMQADRVMPGQSGVPVRFLHGRLLAPVGPAKLSLITGAPIVPVLSPRIDSQSVRISIEPALSPGTGPAQAAVEATTIRLMSVIEGFVARYPDQWLVLHNPWID